MTKLWNGLYRDKHINTSVWPLFSDKNQHADCIKRTNYNIEASSWNSKFMYLYISKKGLYNIYKFNGRDISYFLALSTVMPDWTYSIWLLFNL